MSLNTNLPQNAEPSLRPSLQRTATHPGAHAHSKSSELSRRWVSVVVVGLCLGALGLMYLFRGEQLGVWRSVG